MLEFIYKTLASIGYTEPIHPVATHIPMGMILGGFLFVIASFKWESAKETAHNCLILALAILPITIVFGIMDWQYRLSGVVSIYIIAKLVLAGTMTILLGCHVYLYRKGKLGLKAFVIFYALCLLNAIGLGFIGGRLVYG
jgi:uncharacterized membrane protein